MDFFQLRVINMYLFGRATCVYSTLLTLCSFTLLISIGFTILKIQPRNPIYIVYYIKRQITGNNYRDNSDNFFSRNKIFKIPCFRLFQNSIVLISLIIIFTFYENCDIIVLYFILSVI